MANAKEVEIVNSLRNQGYTSSQIIGAVRQHRHNIKVAAQRRKIEEERKRQEEKSKQDFREEQSTVKKVFTLPKFSHQKDDGTGEEYEYTYENGEWMFDMSQRGKEGKVPVKDINPDFIDRLNTKKDNYVETDITDYDKIISPSATWTDSEGGDKKLSDNILDYRDDDFVANTLTREYGEDFEFEDSGSDMITATHKKTGETYEFETNFVGIGGTEEIESGKGLIKWMKNQKYGGDETHVEVGVTDYRPVLNEDTKEYEWRYVKDGEVGDVISGEKTLETLNLAHPNALNELKYDDFRVIDGEWRKKNEETEEYESISNEEVNTNLDMLYPKAKTAASKRKDGQSAKDYTYNLIDVNKGKEIKGYEEENEKRQNVSYEEWLATDEYYYDGRDKPGFWGTVAESLSFGVSKAGDILDPTYDYKGNELQSFKRDLYENWKNEYKKKLPSNITTNVVNPDAYIQNTTDEPFATVNGVVKPGEYYLSGAEVKKAEDKKLNISNGVISEEEYNSLVLNRNRNKSSTDIEKIEEYWDLNYNGDNSVSEVVEIGINNKFGVEDFKEGTYRLNGQTYNISSDDVEFWKDWKSYNNKYSEGGGYDREVELDRIRTEEQKSKKEIKERGISGEVSELGDSDDDRRRARFLIDQLDEEGEVYQKLLSKYLTSYTIYEKTKKEYDNRISYLDEAGYTLDLNDKKLKYLQYKMDQNSDWKNMFESEGAAVFGRNQKSLSQSMSSKLDYSDAELSDIEDMDDFNKFLEENYSQSGSFEKTIFDVNKGKWVIDNPISTGNVWSGMWGSNKTDVNKANLLNAYYNQKSQKVNNLQDEYEVNGFYEKVDELDDLNFSLEKDLQELNESDENSKYSKYLKFKEQIDSGEIESSEENIAKINEMVTEINVISENAQRKSNRYNGIIIDPRMKLMFEGYENFANEANVMKLKYNNLYKNNKAYKDMVDNQTKIEKASEHWYAPIIAPLEEVFGTVIDYALGGVGFLSIEGADFARGVVGKKKLSKKKKAQAYELFSTMSNMLKPDMVQMGPLFDPKTGEMNITSFIEQSAQTLTLMHMMVRGGGVVRGGFSKVGSRARKFSSSLPGQIIKNQVALTLPRLYSGMKMIQRTKIIPSLGTVGKTLKLKDRAQQVVGGAMAYYPMNVEEAMSQVDENFSYEDAFNSAVTKTMFESGIEALFPDVNMFKNFGRIRSGAKDYLDPKVWQNMSKSQIKKLKGDFLNPKLWLPKDGIIPNMATFSKLFGNMLKEIPKEMIEENLQELASGMVSMQYNNKFDTDFHIPTAEDFKALNVLTPATVFFGGAARTVGFRKGQIDQGMYQAAIENMDVFQEVMRNKEKLGQIKPGQANEIIQKVQNYVLAKSQIDFDEYNSMSHNQRQETLNALVKKEQLRKQIKDTKNPAEEERLRRELNNTEKYIQKLAKQVNLNFKSKKETQLDFEIWNKRQQLKDHELGSEKHQKIRKEILKKIKERNEIRLEASPYEFEGKSYDSLSEFIADIRRAKENGFFDKQSRGNIKINNKVGVDKAQRIQGVINSITGIDNFTGSEVLMSQTDAIESQEFQANPENRGKTLADYELELNEILKTPGKKDANIINDLRNTINYLKLQEKGFEFDQQGVIVTSPEAVSQAMIEMDGGFDFKTFNEAEFDKAVNAVKNVTNNKDGSGVRTEAMTREQMIAAGFHKSVPGSLNAIAFMGVGLNSKTGQMEPILIINKDKSLETGNNTGASHELLHQVLFSVINGPIRQVVGKDGKKYNTKLTPKGKDLIQGLLDLLPPSQRKDLDAVMEARGYKNDEKTGDELPFEVYAEEYLNNFHDIVAGDGVTLYNEDGSIDRVVKMDNRPDNRGILQKIKDRIINFLKGEVEEDFHKLIDTNLDTPEKLLEFLRTYNSQAIDGKFSEDIINMSIGSRVYFSEITDPEVDPAIVSFSKAQQNVQQEVENLMTPKTAAELAAEVNDIYNDDRLTDGQKEFMIAAKYRGMAEARWKEAYRQSVGTDSQKILEDFKEDIISDMLFDLGTETRKARTVVGLVRDFKTEKQKYKNTAAYINTYFKVRAFEVLSKYTKDKGFARSMDDAMNEVSQMEDSIEQLDEAKRIQSGGIVVSERLIEAEKGTDREPRIKQHLVNLNDIINNNPEIAEGKNYKSLPDLDPRGTISMMMSDPTAVYKDDGTPVWQRPAMKKLIGTSILDSIVEKLANNANLNQQDIKALQQYISKHNQLLWIGLPQGFTTRRVKQRDGSFIDRPDKATGVQNVLLEPFYNKAAKPYGNFFPQYKKPSMPTNDFLEVFGITPRREVNIVGKESNVSQRVKALITQHGKIISNQTVRQNENTTDAVRNSLQDGKSMPVFSKALVNSPQQTTNYLQAVSILDRTIPWGEFMSMSVGSSNLKIKEIPSENVKLLRNYIKTALVDAGVDKSLHGDIIKEMTTETGVVISQINLRNSYKGSKEVFPSIVDQARQYWEQEAIEERSVFNALGIDGTYKSIANQEDVITRARQSITDSVVVAMRHAGMDVDGRGDVLLQDVWKKSTPEQKAKALSYIWKTKGQFAASGKIVDGFWTVEYEGGPVIRNKKHIPNKGRMGMQITEGIGDWAALINKALPGIEIIPVKPAMEKGKPRMRTNSHITRQPNVTNDKKLKEMYPNFNKVEISENSNEVIKNLNTALSYKNFNKHKNQALSYRSMLTDQFIAFNNSYNDPNSLTDDRDAAAYIMTLSSGMTSPTRKAAYPWGISDGAKDVPVKDRGTKLEYDHLKPNNVLMLKLADMLKRNLTESEIRAELDVFFSDYVVNIIQKKMDGVVKMNKMQSHMQLEYVEGSNLTDLTKLEQNALGRLFHKLNKYNKEVRAITALDPELKGLRVGEDFVNKSYHNFENIQEVEQRNTFSKAVNNANKTNHLTPSRGMSAFDFDETLIDKGDNTIIATKGEDVVEISSSNWPLQGPQLAADGYDFDFSDFVNVKGGVEGPLMQKFRNRIAKYGIENNYILTARPAEAAPAIQAWLKQQGIDMPIENITGLGNSTGEAKAMWMAEKFAEGYNDMYFVDDALPNVKAVADMLEQLDIKGSSVQAKIQFSRSMNPTFNKVLDGNFQAELDLNRILEQTKGVKAEAVFSDAQAKIRGSAKGKWKFWVPYSAEDFKGLVYRFIGKGRQGEAQMAFFKKALFDPFGRAHEAMNMSKQQLNNQYKELLKQFPNVKKELSDKLDDYTGFEGNQFTVEQAIRVYLWNKNGMEVPGLSQRDLKALVNFVQSDTELKSFAENLALITNQELGYLEPTEYWTVENIDSDINTINNEINREDHLAEWRQNKEIMFGVWGSDGRLVGDNINKIEAIYGTRFREALEDILYRMEFGRKREAGSNRLVNAFNNWANQSVGAIMFFNMRSALLQTISSINYLNWSDNNPLKAGGALLNFPQFLKDFTMIFNSDMLKQRRAGNQRGINEAELAQAVEGVGVANRVKAMLHYLLTKGFLPTQIADSFAISSGGATFYRNRVNTYLKQGMTQEQAETKAFQDFAENTEESQQSSRPDMISQQQASPLGRYILAFKNTPMQYARLTKKAFLDLANGRGDAKTNVGKIIYYMGVQNLIFSALQTALGALIGGDEDEEKEKAFERTANSMIDSILGGLGFGGNVALTLKNTILEYNKQEGKGWNADHTYTILKFFGLSPTISSKGRKLYSAIQTRKFNKEVMKEMDLLDIDNPTWSIIANIVSATTNLPLDRLVKKVDNIDAALTEDITALQRFALLMGWNTWDLKIDDSDVVAVEDEIKEKKEVEKKKKKKIKKEEKKKEKEAEEEVIEKSFIEDQKKEREEGKKDITCVAVNKSGKRCKTKVDGNNTYCTIHVKVDQGTKEVQCKKIKSDKKRCKMKTKAKSGLCYYHD